MIPDTIRLPRLLALVEKHFGPDWHELDPLTIMSFMEFPDYLIQEKLNVLVHLKKEGVNQALENATFVLLLCSAANNNYSDFETVNIPTSLELGWAIEEAKLLATMLGQTFSPSESLSQVAGYILREDGFSVAPPPLEFAKAHLHPGQTEEDSKLKEKGVAAYIQFMKSEVQEQEPAEIQTIQTPQEAEV